MDTKLSYDERLLRDLREIRTRFFKAAMAENFEETENKKILERAIWLMEGTIEYLQRQVDKVKPMLKVSSDSEH